MNHNFKRIWEEQNFVVVDTETTGIKRPAEIIDIAVIDAHGNTLLETLLHPKQRISPFISGLTHITNDMCEESPTWHELKPVLLPFLAGKTVVTYNATFDRHMLHCTDDMWNLDKTDYHEGMEWVCAMEAYAPHHGDWNAYYHSYKWVKLTDAMQEQHLPVTEAHRAKADALMTYYLIKHMVENGKFTEDIAPYTIE